MLPNLGVSQKKTMSANATFLWNETLAILGESNGTFSGVNLTVTNLDGSSGDYSGEDVGGGFWWEEEGASGDPPVVKFGPDPGLLQAIGVFGNLLVLVVVLVLAVGVVCRCVAGKVRLSLNRRRGPEIAFQFGTANEVVDRVVESEVEDRCHVCHGECRGSDGGHAL